jgi:hypothetical protein
VEAILSTSTVILRIIGGDGKGIQYPGVSLGHYVPEGYMLGPGPPDWEIPESKTLRYGYESLGTRAPGPRMTALSRTSSN